MSSDVATHDDRPPWLGTGVAVLSVLVVVALVAQSTGGLVLAVLGGVVLAAGLWWSAQPAVSFGASGLFGAVLLVSVGGESPVWLLLATVPVVLAWTTATHAVRLGEQVGRSGGTWRVQLVQAIATLVVLSVGGGVGYLSSRSVTGSQSPLAIALLLGSVVAVVFVLR